MGDALERSVVQRAWDALLRGEIRASETSAGMGDAGARTAWRAAFDGARWHAAPGSCAFPRVESLLPLVEEGSVEARSAACLACAWGVRASVLAFDYDSLARWTTLMQALGGGDAAQAWVTLARSWERLGAGDFVVAEELATEAAALARACDARPVVIEATALRALATENRGGADSAVATARIALRMARTEELPQWQYLTAIVLARARRLTARPHLALRILRAVQKVAPPPWRAWTTLELLLSGDPVAPDGSEPAPWAREAGVDDVAAACARGLADVLHPLEGGTGDDAIAALRAQIARWPPLRSDVLAAVAASDPVAPEDGVPCEVLVWRNGCSDALPPRLHGLGLLDGARGARRGAYLVVRAGGETRRCLAPGVEAAASSGCILLSSTTPRIEATIASLATAGPAGLATEDLFRAVYGFHYTPGIHHTVLKVLLHRVRAHLTDIATIVRRQGRITLHPQHDFAVRDANVERPLESMVLAALARLDRASARQAAEALRVPARTVQAALHTLVEEGAVVVTREGKHMLYGVEDTCFSEPTRW